MNLGVDPRHADQMVRGVVAMPNGTGKTMRVAVFAKDAKAMKPKPPVPIWLVLMISPKQSKTAKQLSTG